MFCIRFSADFRNLQFVLFLSWHIIITGLNDPTNKVLRLFSNKVLVNSLFDVKIMY